MTTRLKAFIVTLDQDIREDDAESILNALRMVRHVASVEPLPADSVDHVARERVRMELREKLFAVLDRQ